MSDQDKINPLTPLNLLATWFGSGLLPRAPGTWGSLAALPFAWLFLELGGWLTLLSASLFAYGAGIWASGRFSQKIGIHDPGVVVIDEVAGQWLTLVPLGYVAWPYAEDLAPSVHFMPLAPFMMTKIILFSWGFTLFRFFDIVKPWPVGWIDRRLKGGLGIMSDDMVAGLYGALILAISLHSLAE